MHGETIKKILIFFILLLVSSESLLAFRFSFSIFLKCLLASRLTLCRLSTLLCFVSCTHCISACFLWSENRQNSSSIHGLCCFTSNRPTLCLTEVLILSLMFSQTLLMSSLLFKFSICCLHVSKMIVVDWEKGISANKSWFRPICYIRQKIRSRLCRPT